MSDRRRRLRRIVIAGLTAQVAWFGLMVSSGWSTALFAVAAIVGLIAIIGGVFRFTDPSVNGSASGEVRAPSPTPPQPVSGRLDDQLALVARSTRASRALLFVADDVGATLRLAHLYPASPESALPEPLPLGAGALGAALRSGEPLAADVRAATERLCPWLPAGSAVSRVLVLPLTGAPRPAALALERRTDEAFDDDARSLAGAAARTLSWLMASSLSSVHAQREMASLRSLADVADRLARAQDEDEVARLAVEAARTLLPLDRALVVTQTVSGDALRVAHAAGVQPDAGVTVPPDAGLVGRVARVRTPLPTGGSYRVEHGLVASAELPFPVEPGHALAVLPLLAEDNVVGAAVFASSQEEAYSPDALVLLRSLAGLVGPNLARRQLEARLRDHSRTDPLTGLMNRRAFDERFAQSLQRARRYGVQTALLMIDLDHFKSVNDTHGHAVGDVVLQRVGALLKDAGRDVDVPARLGGEEMALLLEHTDEPGAVLVAERVREGIAALPFRGQDEPFRVTASIGVAVYPDHGTTAASLFELADAALYRSKGEGRNRVTTAKSQ